MNYSDLLDSFEQTEELGEIADLEINSINSEEGNIPLKGLEGTKKKISEESSKIISDKTSILISRLGQPKVVRPENTVAPSNSWIVVNFENEKVQEYYDFFQREEVLTKLEDLREGEAMPKASLKDMEELKVPVL
jgi:hypothetical protein